MKILTQNITNSYGEKGKDWINSLPMVINILADHWGLSQVIPFSNMTFNYVAKAILNRGHPVVLKIGYEQGPIVNERLALKRLGSSGSIKLIHFNSQYHALLLQQAIPGITLKSLYPQQMDYVINSYVEMMQKLHGKSLSDKYKYDHIADWLTVLDNPGSEKIPASLLNRAINLRNRLLSSMRPLIFLHGDLHHDNVLKHGNEWVAIDPKGVIGEAEFEIAAFDFMYVPELAITADVKEIIAARIDLLAQKANLDAQRIKDWMFVRLVLMAAWFIEDNGDPIWAIKLAELLIE